MQIVINMPNSTTIEEFARNDHRTNDTQYNNGLRKVKQYGLTGFLFDKDVQYWLMCNNIRPLI